MSTASARRRSPSPPAIKTKPGDVFEIEAAPFGLPLINPLEVGKKEKDRGHARSEPANDRHQEG